MINIIKTVAFEQKVASKKDKYNRKYVQITFEFKENRTETSDKLIEQYYHLIKTKYADNPLFLSAPSKYNLEINPYSQLLKYNRQKQYVGKNKNNKTMQRIFLTYLFEQDSRIEAIFELYNFNQGTELFENFLMNYLGKWMFDILNIRLFFCVDEEIGALDNIKDLTLQFDKKYQIEQPIELSA